FSLVPRLPWSTLFPYTTLFRSTETVRAAQRTRPWVRERLVQIARDYVGAFALDPHAFDDAFGDLDPTDTEAMARMAQRPEVLLRSEEHTSELQSRVDLVSRLLP